MKYVFILVLLIIGGAGALMGGVVVIRWVNNMTQTARVQPGELAAGARRKADCVQLGAPV